MKLKTDPASLGYAAYAYQQPTPGIALQARGILTQCCGLCSEFSKYIAPAYHHDRCERSVQMRLYSMHKREFVMVIVAFSTCLLLSTFIGLAGPPITSQTEQRASSLVPHLNNSEIANGVAFTLRTQKLSSYHQQLWLIAKVETGNTDDETYDEAFHISLDIIGLDGNDKTIILRGDSEHNRTRHLKCHKNACDEVLVMHLGFLDYTHYSIIIRFYGLSSFHARYKIRDISFFFKTYNPDFTQIEIWFRFVFLLSTFIIMMVYAYSLRKYPASDWSMEQRWVSMLLPLLLFFNDPFFPLTFLTSTWVAGMLDAVLQATFLCALLLFWLCIYHGLRQNERRWLTFYGPKLVVVGLLWLSSIIMASWQKCNELHDPTYSYKVDAADFTGYKAFFLTVAGVYFAYLVGLMLRAYSELRTMPFFDMRLRFLTIFLMIVVSVTFLLTTMRYGAGVLEDSFVSELSTTYSSSAHFMCFYGLLNFYLYTMAYVYSPSQSVGFDQTLTKDNPAFSMINESDEEVVYGSEDECRRPLHLSRRHDADDSD